jgi:fimbrial isopeptide formation D2 family protein
MNIGLKRMCGVLASVATLFAAWGGASVASAANSRVSADDLAKDQSIEVDAPAGTDLTGSTFKAVPLAYYSSATTNGTVITSYDLQDAGLAAQVKASLPTGNNADASNPMTWVVQNLLDSQSSPWAGRLRDFLDKLKETTEFQSKVASGTTLTADATNKNIAKALVKPGIYAIADTTGAPKQAAIIALTGTGINGITTLGTGANPFQLGVVDYKVNTTTASKKITKISDTNHGSVASGNKTATATIGQTISYEVDSTVPNWTGYDNFYYGVNDTPSKGLTVDASSVKATVGGTAVPAADIHASVDATSGVLTVKFGTADGDIIPAKDLFKVGAAVVITYQAKLNANAVAGEANKNSATVEYSHNPNDWTNHKTTPPSTTTTTYTGKVSFHKTDVQGNALSGAQFQLLDAKNNNSVIRMVKISDGKYRPATDSDTQTVDTLETDNQGNLTLDGINGQYVLKETQAPAGFDSPVLASVGFTVNVDQTTGAATVSGITEANKLAEAVTNDGDAVHVINARNLTEMPKTGAAWLIIWIAAAVIVLAAGIMLVVADRKRRVNA